MARRYKLQIHWRTRRNRSALTRPLSEGLPIVRTAGSGPREYWLFRTPPIFILEIDGPDDQRIGPHRMSELEIDLKDQCESLSRQIYSWFRVDLFSSLV